MRGKRTGRWRWAGGGLALAAGVWLAAVWPVVGYRPHRSDGWRWVAWHVHSDHSDGLGAPETIARQAATAGVEMVLLTDHGQPNPAAAGRWAAAGVIVVGGSEAATPHGHLGFFGARELPGHRLPPDPAGALADIRSWGGHCVLMYPFDPVYAWDYWAVDFQPQGMELLNLSTSLRRAGWMARLLAALRLPLSPYAQLPLLDPPTAERQGWDHLLARGQVDPYVGTNTHGGFRLAGRAVPLPGYADAFALLALGVDRAAEPDLEAAVRAGRFFACVRGAGEPDRFRFTAETSGRVIPPGLPVPAGADLVLELTPPPGRQARVVLWHDGRPDSTHDGSARRVGVASGVWRAEVHLTDHPLLNPAVPWILTPAIRVAAPPAPPMSPPLAIGAEHPLDLAGFAVETDDRSTATFGPAGEGVWRFESRLADFHPGGPNRWCALADRTPRDLSGWTGLLLRARSDRTARLFVEVRLADRWHYTSVKVTPGPWQTIPIPFDRFYRVMGSRSAPPEQADGLFLSLSNYTLRQAIPVSLDIAGLALYQPAG